MRPPQPMILFASFFVCFLASSAFPLNISYGQGGQYYFSNNVVAAGFTNEYYIEALLGNRSFGRLSYINLDYFGQISGLKLSYERAFIGNEKGSIYSLRIGVYYAAYWGKPVIVIKDNYVDHLPTTFNEIGLIFRPFMVDYGHFSASIFDVFIAIDPLTIKNVNYGGSLFTAGLSL